MALPKPPKIDAKKAHHFAALALIGVGCLWMFLPANTFDQLLFHKIDAWGMLILGNILLLTEKL